jgi:hypothetical protein
MCPGKIWIWCGWFHAPLHEFLGDAQIFAIYDIVASFH